MKSSLTFSTLLGFLAIATASLGQLVVDPAGIAVRVEPGDTLTTVMSLSNDLDQDVTYTIDLVEIENQRAIRIENREVRHDSPYRDRRSNPDGAGYFWVDQNEQDGPAYQWIDITNRQGVRRLNLADNVNSGELDLGFEFPWYREWYTSIRVCSNGWFTFDPDQDGVFARMPEFPNRDDPDNIIAVDCQDFTVTNQTAMLFWTDGEGIAVVSWIGMITQNAPIRQNITFQAILYAESGTIVFQYGAQTGLPAANVNIGYENQDGSLGSSYLFGQAVAEGTAVAITGPFAKWLEVSPEEGEVPANDTRVVTLIFNPEDLGDGTYEMRMGITSIANPDDDDADTSFVEVSAVMTVENRTYNLTGVVTRLNEDQPIAGATASLDRYMISRTTDGEGRFEFQDLPTGNYTVTVTAPDYLPVEAEVRIDRNDVNLDVSLPHAALRLSREDVVIELAPNALEEVRFTGSNIGNGPLSYQVERRLPGNADADPWELRQEYEISQILEDNRIEGVAFDGEFLYFAGANGQNPNLISQVTRDGERRDSFVQPGQSLYGIKDLEFGGGLLWGSGEATVFGFDVRGNLQHSFAGPANPTAAVAYDTDSDNLWLSGRTTNIRQYTTGGQATGVQVERRGLYITGMAYWPEDPDGHPLYVLNNPAGGMFSVHKFRIEDSDTIRVIDLPTIQGGSPGGLYITNAFDIYSWVALLIRSNIREGGGDVGSVYQLAGRTDWFSLEPASGTIAAGESQDFTLSINTAGLSINRFEGDVVFVHDGVGGETSLPIRIGVTDGPVHTDRTLRMVNGWNLVSLNIDPDDRSIVNITRPLVDAGTLAFLKDGIGRFYSPAQGFCNIPGWQVSEGYLFKVNGPCELLVSGVTVAADQPIPLSRGWQAISYYPRDPVDARVALAGLGERLVIVKDGLGRFYLPAMGFSNLGNMVEGLGYLINVNEAVELVYQLGDDGRVAAGSVVPLVEPTHFNRLEPTGTNMSLLLEIPDGLSGEVGLFSDGRLAGSSVITGRRCGIAVWGDDLSTAEIEAAEEGSNLEFRWFDGVEERPIEVLFTTGDNTFRTNGITIGEVTDRNYPNEFGIVSVSPNPFNGTTGIVFQLLESGRFSVKAFDIEGRLVAILSEGAAKGGMHQVVWQAEDISAGTYFIRLDAGARKDIRKALLLK